MPKSKRQTIYNLTKTEKKGRQGKESLVENVREALDKFQHIYVFKVNNMRNQMMKDVRQNWKDSRFFFGRNKVMGKALGSTPEEEYKPNLMKITENLVGNVGLLFTNESLDAVKEYFEKCREADFARGGGVATQDFTLNQGQLMLDDQPVPHNMEPQLRKLGLPTELKQGKVYLREDYNVCSKGKVLTPEQAQILKYFGIRMAEFELLIVCHWFDGEFEQLEEQ